MLQTAKRTLPWILSAGIIAYLVATTDLDAFVDALGSINPLAFTAVAVIGTLVVYLVDCFCLRILFGRFFGAVPFRDLMVVKGTSYFLNVVNYNAGAGGVAVFISRRRGLHMMEALGTMLFLNAMDLFALTMLVVGGLLLQPDVVDAAERTALWWVSAGMGAVLLGTIVFWVFKAPLLPRRVRSFRIFHPFRHSRVSDYPLFIALRALFVLQYVLIHWGFLHVFHVDVPFSKLLVVIPIITFIGVLPISIAGLGTTQLALIVLLRPIPEGIVLAYSTAGTIGLIAARVLIGLITMRSTAQDFIGDKAAPGSEISSAAARTPAEAGSSTPPAAGG